jgi:hypothetical protein
MQKIEFDSHLDQRPNVIRRALVPVLRQRRRCLAITYAHSLFCRHRVIRAGGIGDRNSYWKSYSAAADGEPALIQ